MGKVEAFWAFGAESQSRPDVNARVFTRSRARVHDRPHAATKALHDMYH